MKEFIGTTYATAGGGFAFVDYGTKNPWSIIRNFNEWFHWEAYRNRLTNVEPAFWWGWMENTTT